MGTVLEQYLGRQEPKNELREVHNGVISFFNNTLATARIL